VSGRVFRPLDGFNRTCEGAGRSPESLLDGRTHAVGHLPPAFLVLTLFIFVVAILILEIIVFLIQVVIVLETEGRRGAITHTYVSPSGLI
jgi:hypothetical protein